MRSRIEDRTVIEAVNSWASSLGVKENCRWASKAQQSNNTRRNIKVNLPEFSGTLAQACVFFNMPYDCVRKRLKRGVSIEDALKTPLQPGSAMRQTV